MSGHDDTPDFWNKTYAQSEEEHTKEYEEAVDKFLTSSHQRGSTTSVGTLAPTGKGELPWN